MHAKTWCIQHNLLVGEHWRCKVSDFGLSRMLTAMDTMTSCGTPSWVSYPPLSIGCINHGTTLTGRPYQTAPEVLRGEKYTEKCDVVRFYFIKMSIHHLAHPVCPLCFSIPLASCFGNASHGRRHMKGFHISRSCSKSAPRACGQVPSFLESPSSPLRLLPLHTFPTQISHPIPRTRGLA